MRWTRKSLIRPQLSENAFSLPNAPRTLSGKLSHSQLHSLQAGSNFSTVRAAQNRR